MNVSSLQAAFRHPGTLFRAAVAGVFATSWSALLLAELGWFRPGLALLAGGATGLWMLRPSACDTSRWTPLDGVAVALALASLLFTSIPHLNLLGGWDPGVYLHTASALNRYGSLQFPEADLCTLSGEMRALFARDLHSITEPFLGMRVYQDQFVTPQFYHLYPCLMAAVWPLGGLSAALLVNPLLNVLSLLAVYALVRRLAGPLTALLALAALLLQPAQLWQARFSSAEMLAQFFLWSGFALLIRLDRTDRTLRDAVLAGATLGAAQLARYDTVMVLAPVALILMASLFTSIPRRPVVVVLATLGALVAQAWLHQRWVAPFYAPIPSVVQQALIVLSGLLLAAGLACLHPRTRAGVHHLLRGSGPRLLAIVLVGAWWLFVVFVRPGILDGTSLGDALGQVIHDRLPAGLARGLTGDDAGIGLYLRALWAWPALIAAMAGVLWLVWRERSHLATAWLAGALAVGVVITYRIYNDHFLMWLARRFIPILVPLFAVGLAVACAGLAAWRPRFRGPVAALLLLALLAPRLPASYRMATLREWDGLDHWLTETSRHLPADSMVIGNLSGFASALRYLHHHQAYELNERTPEAWPRLNRWLQDTPQDRPVYLLTRREPDDYLRRNFEPVREVPLQTGRLHHTRRSVPDGLQVRGGPLVIYRWKEQHDPPPAIAPGPNSATLAPDEAH